MLRRLLLQTFLILACAGHPLLAAAAEPTALVVAPGSQKTFFHDQPIKRIAIGDPKVAGVTLISPRSLLITGKQTGATTLLIWDKAGATPSFEARIAVGPQGMDPGLTLDGSGGRLKIAGALTSLEAHHAQTVALAKDGSGKDIPVVDNSASEFDTQVQIDIKVVEVSRKRLMSAGFFLGKNNSSATRAISGPGNLSGAESNDTGGFTLSSSSGFLPTSKAYNLLWGSAKNGVLGALSVLEEDGFAYTLAEPSLTALSGQTASFLAGGEMPIPMRSGTGTDSSTTIKFKEFGIKLSLTPTVLGQDRVFLKVAPEVSELDDTLSVQTGGVSVPGLRVRRTDTSVALGDGESFVLSGLVSRNTTADVSKLPYLADVPILGAFLRSTRFERDDKELLMVVTAHLVRPFAKGQTLPPLPGESLRNYDPSFSDLMLKEKGRFNSSTGFSD